MKQKINGVLLFLLMLLLFTFAIRRNRFDLPRIISSDVEGYYCYLPAFFIEHNLSSIRPISCLFAQNEKGENYTKYTCGLCYCYFPFFIIAHELTQAIHGDASGYSKYYLYAMIACGAFWSAVGLIFLWLLLQRYFSTVVSWLTILIIVFGTNYFQYATKFVGMPHNYNFTIIVLILYLYDSYLRKPTIIKIGVSALLFGLLVLIRPTNIVFLVYPLLYRINSFETLRMRLEFLRNIIRQLFLGFILIPLPWIPQLFYWKKMTGHWPTYSYNNEKFIYWNHPKIAEVLFDSQNGLLLYAPILILSFIGLIRYAKDIRISSAGFGIVFCIITYIFASWWAWWFGAAYGHRCYIDYLPLFSFPIAALVEHIVVNKKIILAGIFYSFVIMCCYYNLKMSQQFDKTGVWDGKEWQWNYGKWYQEFKASCLR